MSLFCHARPWLALALAAALSGDVSAGEMSTFDHLYVEANEGASSGGHTAIRFGARTYHFENRDGLLVLRRESAESFVYQYALLGNRPIHVSRIETNAASRANLLAHFERRRHAQRLQLDVRAALREDLALLRSWQRHATSPGRAAGPAPRQPVLRIPAAGYFFPPSPADAAGSARSGASPALAALRVRILAHHGELFLALRRGELAGALVSLSAEDPTTWRIELPGDALDVPPFSSPWARRYRAVVAGIAALDVLDRAPSLQPIGYAAPSGDAFALDPSELESLRATAARLEDELVRLVGSRRSDWGTAFLVGAARLAALHQSLRSGRLVFLDTFPDDAPRVARDVIERNRDRLPAMLAETRARLRASRMALVSAAQSDDGPVEIDWARVEEAANRHYELSRAASTESPFRVARGPLVPERSARLSDPGPLRADAAALGHAVARAEERLHAYSRRLDGLYRYRLIAQNCASEILDAIDATLAPAPAAAHWSGATQAGERGRGGGSARARQPLAFVPFVSAASLAARYRVVERYVVPSFRAARIAEMAQREPRAVVALRESNTLTARSYRRGQRDSLFIFFTDGSPLLRPLLGVANLLAATGESAYGLLRLPADRGRTLASGLSGAAMSLPELAFANIRKGTNDWIAPDRRRSTRERQ